MGPIWVSCSRQEPLTRWLDTEWRPTLSPGIGRPPAHTGCSVLRENSTTRTATAMPRQRGPATRYAKPVLKTLKSSEMYGFEHGNRKTATVIARLSSCYGRRNGEAEGGQESRR